MVLPAGFEYETQIILRGTGLYQLQVPANSAGVYRHDGSRLAVKSPRDKRLTEFVWEIQSKDLLLLTEAPPAAKVGADYRGAVLRRMPAESVLPTELKEQEQEQEQRPEETAAESEES
ncbi:MAG: hypothetical protein RIK87_20770 [Fuerstiella sp.]